jgi:4-diphosphocytidyl-2-C-methyl-D-erythritol kinase
VLFALDKLTGTGTSGSGLIRLGAAVGADVPFFLFRSPAWARGIGEELTDGPALPDYTFLLVRQAFGISTKWAFSQYDLTKNADNLEYAWNHRRAPIGLKLRNDLEPVVCAAHPEVKQAMDVLLEQGAGGAIMTGSGPTVFAVFEGREAAQKAGEAAARALGCEVVQCRALRGPLLKEVVSNQE